MKRVFQTIFLATMVAAGGFAYAGSAELSAGSKLLEEANGAMHQSMSMDMTGDVDVDFMLSMIPHHEGAVDMAKIVIEHGADPGSPQARRGSRESAGERNRVHERLACPERRRCGPWRALRCNTAPLRLT